MPLGQGLYTLVHPFQRDAVSMVSNSLLLSSAVLGAALWTVPTPASAAPLTFLNGAIITSIPAKDIPAFRAVVGDVLNNGADGAKTQWASTARSASRPSVQVEFTPLQTVQTQTANTCRLLEARVSRFHSSEEWLFWFCQQDDGSWKASGSDVPQ